VVCFVASFPASIKISFLGRFSTKSPNNDRATDDTPEDFVRHSGSRTPGCLPMSWGACPRSGRKRFRNGIDSLQTTISQGVPVPSHETVNWPD
jgi:hypothetical protein